MWNVLLLTLILSSSSNPALALDFLSPQSRTCMFQFLARVQGLFIRESGSHPSTLDKISASLSTWIQKEIDLQTELDSPSVATGVITEIQTRLDKSEQLIAFRILAQDPASVCDDQNPSDLPQALQSAAVRALDRAGSIEAYSYIAEIPYIQGLTSHTTRLLDAIFRDHSTNLLAKIEGFATAEDRQNQEARAAHERQERKARQERLLKAQVRYRPGQGIETYIPRLTAAEFMQPFYRESDSRTDSERISGTSQDLYQRYVLPLNAEAVRRFQQLQRIHDSD